MMKITKPNQSWGFCMTFSVIALAFALYMNFFASATLKTDFNTQLIYLTNIVEELKK